MPSNPYLPRLPKSGLELPDSPLIAAALEYTRKHTTPIMINYCIRTAYFAMLLAHKIPLKTKEPIDLELVAYCNIMHDLGCSQDHTFISKDKRFEVDSADLARTYIEGLGDSGHWDKHRTQLMWDSIALHVTPSFAQHKEPEVLLTHLGVMADIFGPALPGGAVTVEEYQEIVKAFPRLEFREQVLEIFCGLCAFKPETTYDNFVSDFGVKYGVDGKGKDKEAFAQARLVTSFPETLSRLLDDLRKYEE